MPPAAGSTPLPAVPVRPLPRLAAVLGGQRLAVLARSHRRAHAYLLVGPRGSGRRTAAAALAASLLCLDPTADADACGACASCRALTANSHPDLHVLAGHRLDDARALVRAAALRPAQGERSVFILADVDELTPEATAALLKPIEEPAVATVFVLTAVAPGHVPDTIVSRCQVVPLLPVPVGDLVPWLIERGVEPVAATDAAEAAGGRPGRALALTGDPAWLRRHAAARAWLDGAATRSLGEALTQAAGATETTDLGEVTAALRDRARMAAAAGDARAVLEACDGFDAALGAAAALDGHVSQRLTWEVLALRLRRRARVRYNLSNR